MDLVTLAKAKKYTDDSIEGTSGVLKGKNCTIKSIEKNDGVNTVTFQWTADDGTVKTSTMQVADGIAGVGTDGKSAYQVWLDLGNTGTEEDFLNSLKGEKGADGTMTFEDLTEEQKAELKGEDGFSPIITENADNSDEVYKLDIETKDNKFTTPNLKGKDGSKSYAHSVKVIGTVGSTYYSTVIDYDKIREVYETDNPITGLYGGWTLDKVESDDASMEAFSKFAICLDKQITATPDYISVYDLFSIQYEPSASVEPGSEYTVTYEWNDGVIDDDTTDSDTTWSSKKIKEEFDKISSDTPNATYIINCVVISETDGNAEVVSYDGDFIKIQQTIADGGKVELRTNFNSSNYILEPSCVEEDYISFNTVNKNANITIKVTEYGINDISYIDLTSGGEGGGGHIELTQAEYDVLTDEEKMNGKEYRTYDKGHIYKLGIEYGKDAYFTSLSQLGLTAPTTVGEVFMAMPEKSMLMLNVEALVDDGTNVLTVTDMPAEYGVLTIDKWSNSRFRIEFNTSREGSSTTIKQWIGTLKGIDGTGLVWEEVNTGVKADIPIIENGKDVVQHKITKNRSITELEAYTDRNGGTCYKIDDLYLTYDCEKLAKGFDDWFAEKGITPVKGETYEDIAQIQVYSPSAGGYVYLSTNIEFDGTTYLIYNIKYNDTNYTITSVPYDHTNGKTTNTFTGLNVFNIAKIIPELTGYYIQSDILDVLHNWFELYKPIGLEDSVGLYSKEEALLNQDLIVNTSIESRTVGPFDLGNIVSLMTSPLQKLLFSVDPEGKNLKAFANDEKKRTTSLTNGLFGSNLLATKNTFATLNDMSTLPTPPDGALGIWTVVPDAPGQPESTNKGGTLIIAHITSELYSQTINYIGTRIAIYVTQGAIYYALGYGGKYYPTASWTPASGGAFRWYKISSTLV